MLGDQNRRAVDDTAELRHNRVERLRPASGGADDQNARRGHRHRTQHDRRVRLAMQYVASA